MRLEFPEERPVIFPGQTEIVVGDDGETDVREVLIPPPSKQPRIPDQMALGLSEVAL